MSEWKKEYQGLSMQYADPTVLTQLECQALCSSEIRCWKRLEEIPMQMPFLVQEVLGANLPRQWYLVASNKH